MVLFGHAFSIMGESPPFFLGVEVNFFGLLIFFSISGYLISESWVRDPSVFRYLAKRCLRIFPALTLLILLSTFFLGPALSKLSPSEYFLNSQTYDYLKNILLLYQRSLPRVFENNPLDLRVNGSLWTLLVEFFMYLLMPLLVFFKGRRNALIFIVLIMLLFLMDSLLKSDLKESRQLVAHNFIIVSIYFLAGASVRFIFGEDAIPIAFATSMFALNIGLYYLTNTSPYILNALLVFTLPCFVNALGGSSRVHFLNLDRVGDLSYGIYLYAFPIQQIIAEFFIGQISVLTSIMLATIPTICLAYVSWHLIEKKSLALKPRAVTAR